MPTQSVLKNDGAATGAVDDRQQLLHLDASSRSDAAWVEQRMIELAAVEASIRAESSRVELKLQELVDAETSARAEADRADVKKRELEVAEATARAEIERANQKLEVRNTCARTSVLIRVGCRHA